MFTDSDLSVTIIHKILLDSNSVNESKVNFLDTCLLKIVILYTTVIPNSNSIATFLYQTRGFRCGL